MHVMTPSNKVVCMAGSVVHNKVDKQAAIKMKSLLSIVRCESTFYQTLIIESSPEKVY